MLIKDCMKYTIHNYYGDAFALIIKSFIYHSSNSPYRGFDYQDLSFRIATHNLHDNNYLRRIKKAYIKKAYAD